MTALPTPTAFDYAILDPVVADKARAAADRIRTLTRAAVQDVGRELLEIKKQVERGQFTAWVEHECGINIRTAQRAMNAAQLVAENDKLSYLPQDGLLALCARSTPVAVRSLVIDKIERGERPTVAEIKEEITAHSPRPKTAPARETPKVIEDTNPLGLVIGDIKALSDELYAEFERWWLTYSAGRQAVAETIEMSADGDRIETPATCPTEAITPSVGADPPTERARMEPAPDCNNRNGKCRYSSTCVGTCKVQPPPMINGPY